MGDYKGEAKGAGRAGQHYFGSVSKGEEEKWNVFFC